MTSQTEPTRVSMMLSAPYSGATLFALMLDQEPLLCCDGETFSARPEQDCSCGETQFDCPYYSNVAEHMRNRTSDGWDYSQFRHTPAYSLITLIDKALSGYVASEGLNRFQRFVCRLPPFQKRERAFVDSHRKFVENCVARRGVDVYIDGSKIPRRAEIFALHEPFQLTAIHLVRDGRGFCNSFRKNTQVNDLRGAACRWADEIRKVDAFCERFPSVPLLRVRYEDLCRDSNGTVDEVRRFLGIPTGNPIDFDSDDDHHVIGNRMRRNFDGVIREDLAWKESIDRSSLAEIEKIMGEGLTRFGYL